MICIAIRTGIVIAAVRASIVSMLVVNHFSAKVAGRFSLVVFKWLKRMTKRTRRQSLRFKEAMGAIVIVTVLVSLAARVVAICALDYFLAEIAGDARLSIIWNSLSCGCPVLQIVTFRTCLSFNDVFVSFVTRGAKRILTVGRTLVKEVSIVQISLTDVAACGAHRAYIPVSQGQIFAVRAGYSLDVRLGTAVANLANIVVAVDILQIAAVVAADAQDFSLADVAADSWSTVVGRTLTCGKPDAECVTFVACNCQVDFRGLLCRRFHLSRRCINGKRLDN